MTTHAQLQTLDTCACVYTYYAGRNLVFAVNASFRTFHIGLYIMGA